MNFDGVEWKNKYLEAISSKKYKDGFDILKQAADSGDKEACCELGSHFYRGTLTCFESYKTADYWFKKAFPLARAYLMKAFLARVWSSDDDDDDGKGGYDGDSDDDSEEERNERSKKWLAMCEGTDDVLVQAELHYDKKEFEEALPLYQICSELGNTEAMYSIGGIFILASCLIMFFLKICMITALVWNRIEKKRSSGIRSVLKEDMRMHPMIVAFSFIMDLASKKKMFGRHIDISKMPRNKVFLLLLRDLMKRFSKPWKNTIRFKRQL